MNIESFEIPLPDIASAGPMRAAFHRIQSSWIEAGITRWLALLDPHGTWPTVVLALRDPAEPSRLLGTVIGVWAPEPIDRFDDFLELPAPGGLSATDRPETGVWHFIAATLAPEARGLHLSHPLLAAAVRWVRETAPAAQARTLSPVEGILPLVAPSTPESADFADRVLRAVRAAATSDGKPALPIMRLHLGAGAWLDRVLFDSRRDEVRGGRLNLRFAYALPDEQRRAQQTRYQTWVDRRRAQIQSGRAQPWSPSTDGSGAELWLVGDEGDDVVLAHRARREGRAG